MPQIEELHLVVIEAVAVALLGLGGDHPSGAVGVAELVSCALGLSRGWDAALAALRPQGEPGAGATEAEGASDDADVAAFVEVSALEAVAVHVPPIVAAPLGITCQGHQVQPSGWPANIRGV